MEIIALCCLPCPNSSSYPEFIRLFNLFFPLTVVIRAGFIFGNNKSWLLQCQLAVAAALTMSRQYHGKQILYCIVDNFGAGLVAAHKRKQSPWPGRGRALVKVIDAFLFFWGDKAAFGDASAMHSLLWYGKMRSRYPEDQSKMDLNTTGNIMLEYISTETLKKKIPWGHNYFLSFLKTNHLPPPEQSTSVAFFHEIR